MRISHFSIKVPALFFMFTIITSYGSVPKEISKNKDVEVQSLTFNTDGLFNAEFFDYIFRGQFENVQITRENNQFLMLFEQYLRTFGRQCPNNLPSTKVEIMNWVCATEEVTTNGYGIETSRVCIDWTTVGSGLYARRDLYEAKLKVERIQSTEIFRNTLAMMADPNSIGNSVDMIHKANGIKNDMAQLFNLNRCDSPGVRRFEENLKSFALNEPGIRMKEASKYATMKETGGPTGNQNFTKLVDDLVVNHSKTWAFNRYEAGSISGLQIHSKDSQGRPKDLKANYRYRGFGASSAGWVRVTFTNGLPKCIYFFDFPNNCKTPNSSIVASYAQGSYTK